MNSDDWGRLARLVAGEGTPAELDEIETWSAEDPERAKALAGMRSAWSYGADKSMPVDKARMWESIVRRKSARSNDMSIASPRVLRTMPRSRQSTRMRMVSWVSAACLLIGAAVYGPRLMHRNDRKVAQTMTPPREFVTSRGQRAEVRLTDGTKVILAAQSRLTVPANYDSLGREVTLSGEAYFDVVHNSARPFVVRAGQAAIRDLGTRFDVRAYPDRTDLRVLVTQGKVVLEPDNKLQSSAQALVRGQSARLRADGKVQVASNVDTAAFLAWTTGELVFNRTPASEAVAEISRWYDVDITLDPVLMRRTLTTALIDQSLSEVVQLVALSLDAKVVRNGSKVRLIPNH